MKKFTSVGLLLFGFCAHSQTNLIKNGGFESDLENWRGEVAVINPYDKKAGNKSCLINQFVGKEWKGIDQIVNVPKETYAIEFSVWIKADNIEELADKFSSGLMNVELMTSSEKNIAYESIASVVGTSNWKHYKKVVKLTEETKKFRVMLALAKTSGSVYFDEVKAITISQESFNKLMEKETESRKPVVTSTSESKKDFFSNGNFEDGLKNWRGNATVNSTIKKEGKNSISITSATNDWVGIDQITDLPENASTLDISVWIKSENIKQGKDVWNNGLVTVEFSSDGKTKTGEDQNVAFVTGTTDWTNYKKALKIPSGSKKFRVMVAMGFATGTMFVDDIVISSH
ncbi:carbohydrate binding domain-containing protein [uncultured Flavobacterium sp.]|uniref:carbohydrate binding domain-containing protein n=1 Tax=uncultured Flavobacterium sp. TaxID=165435 RepID=UPI0025D10C9B|nr:carbohydrate binding domain-containing protein [uncultured Flavobacterium sp.]